jgi:lysophospholipase L1-like esterase
MLKSSPIVGILLLAGLVHSSQALEIRDNDKIALLGNTFIERAQKYGYIETAITSANPDKNLTFRNLGWSGDTVFGHSRSYFGPPSEGFNRLQKLIEAEKPTLMLLNFGANASYEGEAGIEKFVQGYERLIKMLQEASPNARIALLTPLPQEQLPPPLPPADKHNAELAMYRNAIVKIGEKHGFVVVDLFEAFGEGTHGNLTNAIDPLTDNGLHLTQGGYWYAIPTIQMAFGQQSKPWKHTVNYQNKASFTFQPKQLMAPPVPEHTSCLLNLHHGHKNRPQLIIKNLPKGKWKVTDAAGNVLASETAEKWATGLRLNITPDAQQAEQLRQAINQKNRLFFHKHRPQNETYLFGFRKHEQGNNAAEIPKFQPLIEAKEKEIAKLRVPQAYKLTISKE